MVRTGGANGALRSPHRISGNLGEIELNSASQSPNGRFMYVAAESTEQGRYDSVAPSIVAYRVQP